MEERPHSNNHKGLAICLDATLRIKAHRGPGKDTHDAPMPERGSQGGPRHEPLGDDKSRQPNWRKKRLTLRPQHGKEVKSTCHPYDHSGFHKPPFQNFSLNAKALPSRCSLNESAVFSEEFCVAKLSKRAERRFTRQPESLANVHISGSRRVENTTKIPRKFVQESSDCRTNTVWRKREKTCE